MIEPGSVTEYTADLNGLDGERTANSVDAPAEGELTCCEKN